MVRKFQKWQRRMLFARPAGSDSLGKCSLRIQLNLQLTVEDQLLEQLILSDISGNHVLERAILQTDEDKRWEFRAALSGGLSRRSPLAQRCQGRRSKVP
jgi:hypothetical protein